MTFIIISYFATASIFFTAGYLLRASLEKTKGKVAKVYFPPK